MHIFNPNSTHLFSLESGQNWRRYLKNTLNCWKSIRYWLWKYIWWGPGPGPPKLAKGRPGVAHGQSTVLFWPSVHVTCHKPNELNTRDIITCHSQFWTLTKLAWKRFDLIFFPSSYSLIVSLYIVSVPLCTYLDSHKCKLSPYHGKILRTP